MTDGDSDHYYEGKVAHEKWSKGIRDKWTGKESGMEQAGGGDEKEDERRVGTALLMMK